MKKLTIQDVQRVAENCGGKCLSDEYINAKTKLKWQCSQGHIWCNTLTKIKDRSQWCPYCVGQIKHTIEDAQNIAKLKNGKCLSTKYVNGKTKLKWKCCKNHIWESSFHSVNLSHTWCPECAGVKKGTISQMRKLADSRKGKCLSNIYINAYTKLEWECGHCGCKWMAKPCVIKNGSWCPACLNKKNIECKKNNNCKKEYKKILFERILPECLEDKRIKILQDAQQIAISRGGKCISDIYEGSNKKLQWQCSEGHSWFAAFHNVRSNKSWCPVCSLKKGGEKIRLTIEEMGNIASKNGGKCLSEEYNLMDGKLLWECSRGHIWEATPLSVKHGNTWCPVCSGNNISEKICRVYFEEIFGKRFLKVKPEWLINSNGNRMELDGYCDELKLAFEYQGQQHYKDSRMLSRKISLIQRQQNDKLKRKLCIDNNVYLVEIPYTVEYKDMGNYIMSQCKLFSDKMINKDIIYTKFDIYNKDSKLEELKGLAKNFGGECLSDFYVRADVKMKWRCKVGHEFEAVAYSVKNNQWCPYCAGNRSLGMDAMHELARKYGGQCLSEEYKRSDIKLTWKCNNGHVFEKRPDHVKNRKRWCPTCSKLSRKNKKLNSVTS